MTRLTSLAGWLCLASFAAACLPGMQSETLTGVTLYAGAAWLVTRPAVMLGALFGFTAGGP